MCQIVTLKVKQGFYSYPKSLLPILLEIGRIYNLNSTLLWSSDIRLGVNGVSPNFEIKLS